jgi:hypothetical protein
MKNARGAMGGGTRSNRVGRWDDGGTMDGAMSSGRSIFLYFRLVFFLPDFRYCYGFLKLVVVGCTESSTTCRNPRGLGKITYSLQSGYIVGTYIISD